MRSFWLLLHLLSVIVWVGGMVFAHYCLRPEAAKLDPPQRLPLMAGVLGRFFAFVTPAIALLWASGLAMMAAIGWKLAPLNLHLMMGIAVVMTVIYGVIRGGLYPRLTAAVARGDWPAGGAAMGGLRGLVHVNLWLGVLTIVVAVMGR